MGTGYYIFCNNCITKENITDRDIENGTVFDISTGGSRRFFTKEQMYPDIRMRGKNFIKKLKLKLNWNENDIDYFNDLTKKMYPIRDKEILEIINDKIKKKWKFCKSVGSLPYYCENCKSLESNFYFCLKKKENEYIPQYKCKKCNSELKSISLDFEIKEGMGWANDLKKYKMGELRLYLKNDIVEILGKDKKEFKIKCKNCNGEIFKLIFAYEFD